MDENRTFTLPEPLAFRVLEILRLTHIYALKDSHPKELPDLKHHKWTNEIEFANESMEIYRAVLGEFCKQRDITPIGGSNNAESVHTS